MSGDLGGFGSGRDGAEAGERVGCCPKGFRERFLE